VGDIPDPPGPPASDEEFRRLVLKLADRIAELEATVRATGNRRHALGFSDEKLKTIAEWLYSERIYRSAQFNSLLFGEPAWDMLLDLFIQKVAGRRVSSGSLCLGANVPLTTGLRYIELLEDDGLVRRYTPADDKRLALVEYTPDGYKRMREYLSLAMTRFKIPMPD
jgi:predicted transcriptional regulator